MIRKLTQGPRFLVNKINEIIDYSNRQTGIRGDGFINVNNSPEMPTVRLDINKLRTRIGRQLGGGIGSELRRAQVAEEAPMGNIVECKLWKIDGTGFEQEVDPESPDPENPEYIDKIINVNCDIAGGPDLSTAWPYILENLDITVYNDNGTWRCTWGFQHVPACV